MSHKWLAVDPPQEPSKEILAVQTTNVTITTLPAANGSFEVTECSSFEELVAELSDDELEDEDDKENSADNSPTLNCHHNTTVTTKLVLEKSLSISLFPDAPTTPKVCRKTLYDDEDDLKEIVKKYQTSENQPKLPPCCNSENTGECLLCHPKLSPSKKQSLELDKGIIC